MRNLSIKLTDVQYANKVKEAQEQTLLTSLAQSNLRLDKVASTLTVLCCPVKPKGQEIFVGLIDQLKRWIPSLRYTFEANSKKYFEFAEENWRNDKKRMDKAWREVSYGFEKIKGGLCLQVNIANGSLHIGTIGKSIFHGPYMTLYTDGRL